MSVRTTYMKAKVVLADGEHDLRIGLNDQEAAKGRFKAFIDEIPEEDGLKSLQWLRFAAYLAAKRELGFQGSEKQWDEQYVGLEIEDGEIPGTPPA